MIVHIFVKYWLIFKLFSLAHFVDKSTLHHHVKLKLSKMSKLGLRDVIGHVTIGLGICGFLLAVHINHASILHRSLDMATRRGLFPIGGQWWPCAYLARVRRYGASKILGSRVWPFGVTWRHHMTLDSAYVVSYWWSIGTMHLSCTVTEILGPKAVSYTHLTLPTKRIV